MESRVYISSLPWAVSKAAIINLLSEHNLVSGHIQVVRKGSFLQNGSFCSAFVTFDNADMAVRAIGLLDGRVDSRFGPVALKAEMARPKPTIRPRSRTPVRVPQPKVQIRSAVAENNMDEPTAENKMDEPTAENNMDEPTAAGAQNKMDEPTAAGAQNNQDEPTAAGFGKPKNLIPRWLATQYSKDSVQGKKALTFLADGFYGVLWCTGHGDRSWTVFGPNAEWRKHMWTTADWLKWDAMSPCPLFAGEGGITALAVGLDWLHCKYLGTDMHVYGSILKLLCFFILPSSAINNLQTVWGDIKSFYKELGTPVRYKYITKLSMFIPAKSPYPKLRGKGAEVKYLSEVMLKLWQKYLNPHLRVHKQIELMLRLNAAVEQTIIDYREALFFPAAVAATFATQVEKYLLLLTAVAEHYLEDRLFDITSKTHFVQHCALQSHTLSPRAIWCFMGEDMQKKMQTLAKACVKGQGPVQATRKVAQRYRLALHLQLSQLDD
ncbi:hypothetical protein AK812_SmicGene34259 [Symbiodinium microadriaticum]|uniref:RRM domain-containing protein n=1 Tax=Symbiodinium microadriaticum TaxID=2951 RepID=A0A1Q9CPN0_SYMMI|nr:hypothetical protein AK812_SmicGene34259 [Symbiodinium microadriaticum]